MGLKPLFASAPRIKLRIGNNVLGYALGFNVSVSTDVQPVYVLGAYGPVSLEPTMYNTVTGTMQIMRLRSFDTPAENYVGMSGKTVPDDKTAKPGSSIAAVTASNGGATNAFEGQATLYKHTDPRTLLVSKSFDVDVYLKAQTDSENEATKEYLWMVIKNCRITSRSTSISMGQLVNQPVNFQGLLLSPTDGTGTPLFSSDDSVKEFVKP